MANWPGINLQKDVTESGGLHLPPLQAIHASSEVDASSGCGGAALPGCTVDGGTVALGALGTVAEPAIAHRSHPDVQLRWHRGRCRCAFAVSLHAC